MTSVVRLLAQAGAPAASPSALDNVKTAAAAFQAVVTAVAIVVGGVWAYFKFVKERTYRPRLEVGMAGEWCDVQGTRLLHARVTVKNIGTSVVTLRQKGTGLRLSRVASIPVLPGAVGWTKVKAFSIFEEHSWIEPGETISDDLLLRADIPAAEPTLLETRLVWSWRESEGNIVVFARKIVGAESSIEGASRPRSPTATHNTPGGG
jgi:hypothetical protein